MQNIVNFLERQENDESPENSYMQRLSTIKEMNQSAEKETEIDKNDSDFSQLKQRLFIKNISDSIPSDIQQITQEIVSQMDIHKNGILYLKELVSFYSIIIHI